jgi:hypothetical protein
MFDILFIALLSKNSIAGFNSIDFTHEFVCWLEATTVTFGALFFRTPAGAPPTANCSSVRRTGVFA